MGLIMWGIVPAAGIGSRIQPLGFSKELLPVGSRHHDGASRPRAVSEYLLQRMIIAGVDKICFVISPGKSDIMEYFGANYGSATLAYVVQPQAHGLCDAIFRAGVVIDHRRPVVVGLPDTIWFPDNALSELPDDALSFLLFPVVRPELFDAVVIDDADRVREIQVKQHGAASNWVWGAFKMPGAVFSTLKSLWHARRCQDEYIGTLVNAYLAEGGAAVGIKAGESYADVGTVDGYRAAMNLLAERDAHDGNGSLVAQGRFAPVTSTARPAR
jgi:dTDP-glucose pyrophosphorylase